MFRLLMGDKQLQVFEVALACTDRLRYQRVDSARISPGVSYTYSSSTMDERGPPQH